MELTDTDYENVLDYYEEKIPRSRRLLKKNTESILAKKLCRCIKKIKGKYPQTPEGRSIGICTKSIFNRKGLTRGKFKCIGKKNVTIRKINKKKSKTYKKGSKKQKTEK